MPDEFTNRYAGRYFGKYRAIVTRTDDPQARYRIMARVPAVMGNEEVGWALPAPPSGGGKNTGGMAMPEKLERLWVEFEEGDPSRPIWSHGSWGMSGGTSMVPLHSQGSPDVTDYSSRDVGVIPPSQFAGAYGKVEHKQTLSGHIFEFDDTPGSERVQLSHRTGSRIEMTSDGGVQEVAAASFTQKVGGTYRLEVSCTESTQINAGSELRVKGARTEVYDTTYNQVFGGPAQRDGANLTENWTDFVNTTIGGDWQLSSGSNGVMVFGGGFHMGSGKKCTLYALDGVDIAASPSSIPTKPIMLLSAYGGDLSIAATSPLGRGVSGTFPEILLKGNALLDNILIGGETATEPFVLGNLFKDLFKSILTAISTHTHVLSTGGSASPSTKLGSITPLVWIPALDTILSTRIKGLY